MSRAVERALASRPAAASAGLVVVSLVGATIAVALVERFLAIPYAAPVYLLAVLVVGLFGGTLDKTELGFEQMNAALKQRFEAAS